VIAPEHRFDARAQIELVGERCERLEHARIDALARKIECETGRLDAAVREALRILGKQLPRVGARVIWPDLPAPARPDSRCRCALLYS